MFTRYGTKVAFLACLWGIVWIIGSFFTIDYTTTEIDRLALKQSSGWFEQGSIIFFFGLTLGVLCEISNKLDQRIPPKG